MFAYRARRVRLRATGPLTLDAVERAERDTDPGRRMRLLALAESDVAEQESCRPERYRGTPKLERDARILSYDNWPADRIAWVEGMSRQAVDDVLRRSRTAISDSGQGR